MRPRSSSVPPGLVIRSWPATPDLAAECNRTDLPAVTGVDVVGVIPEGAGRRHPDHFADTAPTWFLPTFLESHLHRSGYA
jgi:hypothetical protein